MKLTAQDKLAVQHQFQYFKRVHGYCPSKISDFPKGTFSTSELPYVKRYIKELNKRNKRKNPEPILPTTLRLSSSPLSRHLPLMKPYRIEDSNNKIIWEGWWEDMPIDVPDTYQSRLDSVFNQSIEVKNPLFKGGWIYHAEYGWDHRDSDDGTKKSEELRNLKKMKAVAMQMGVQQQKAWDEWDWDEFKRNPSLSDSVKSIINYYETLHGHYPLNISDFPPNTFTEAQIPYAKKYIQELKFTTAEMRREGKLIPRIELSKYFQYYALINATKNYIIWEGEWNNLPIKLDSIWGSTEIFYAKEKVDEGYRVTLPLPIALEIIRKISLE